MDSKLKALATEYEKARKQNLQLRTALQNEQPMMLSVYFTDHSFKKVMIDADTCVHDMLKTISATLKVRAIDTYALYDVSTVYGPTVLDAGQNIMNVIDEWQKIVKLGKGRFAKKCEACC